MNKWARLVLLACALLCVGALPSRPWRRSRAKSESKAGQLSAGPTERTRYFDQVQDHFDATNTNRWKQRYFINQTFFNGDGPVFLCVGGEGPPLSEMVVVTGEFHCGWMIVLAQTFGALIIAVEHRFYGLSQPAPDLSTEYLGRYLSSEQALSDLATLRRAIAHEFGLSDARNRWVSFGGSYPGMLAAWSRSKFPTLFHAAIASSAPVSAVVNMREYNDAVAAGFADPLAGGSPACEAALRAAFAAAGAELADAAGRQRLAARFGLCPGDELVRVGDRASFIDSLADAINTQGNDPSCEEAACNIKRQCSMMLTNISIPPIDRLAEVVRAVQGGACVPGNRSAELSRLFDPRVTSDTTERVWTYQTCSEFAFFQTCDPQSRCLFTSHPHLNNIETYYDICMEAFGIDPATIHQRVRYSNEVYGGLHLKASRILFINGLVDPWRTRSVLTGRPGLPAIIVPGASHHFWTHPPQPTDGPEIYRARAEIAQWVRVFLDEP